MQRLESFMARQVEEDMVEDMEVMDPDHPRVVSQNDVAVKVHTAARLEVMVVSFLAKQAMEDTVEDMVLAAVESRVRDRQRAAARVRVARDQVVMDQVMVDMAVAREVLRVARQDRVMANMVEDIVLGICVSLSKCLYKRCVAYVKCA